MQEAMIMSRRCYVAYAFKERRLGYFMYFWPNMKNRSNIYWLMVHPVCLGYMGNASFNVMRSTVSLLQKWLLSLGQGRAPATSRKLLVW